MRTDAGARETDGMPGGRLAMRPNRRDVADAYCRMLDWQVELLWRHELPILAAAPALISAETIIDLGAGNGAFGRRLAATYPEKRFLGVEPDAAMHAVGARTASPPNYSYVNCGFESITGTHDLVLARHVLPFVPDRDALYAWAVEHVRALIVVSWADDAITTEPPLAAFAAALGSAVNSHIDERSLTLRGKDVLGHTELTAVGLRLCGTATLHVDESGPDGRRIFHHTSRAMVETINPDAMSRALLDELYDWSCDPVARLRFAMRYHSVLNPSLARSDVGRTVAA